MEDETQSRIKLTGKETIEDKKVPFEDLISELRY